MIEFHYTDGSSSNGQAGCAVTGRDLRRVDRLPNNATVFTPELFAIHQAMIHMKEKKLRFSVICSDSKSSLQP